MMKQNQHPNVIYILADDMGYGDFGIFSDGSARTPHLDRLFPRCRTVMPLPRSAPRPGRLFSQAVIRTAPAP